MLAIANLRKTYVKLERKQYVERLDRGIEHLQSIELLETVASVRDSLDAKALAQANQKASQVVRSLEQLLQILQLPNMPLI